jgi:ABC-type transport system involved in multi-copper enzyme maturation permease subunit
LVYILLAMFFATWGRSPIAGIGGALGFYFIEAILVGVFHDASGWSHRIPDYLISHNSQALLVTGLSGPFGSSTNVPSGLHASIVIAIYGAVLFAAALYLFRRQDLTA